MPENNSPPKMTHLTVGAPAPNNINQATMSTTTAMPVASPCAIHPAPAPDTEIFTDTDSEAPTPPAPPPAPTPQQARIAAFEGLLPDTKQTWSTRKRARCDWGPLALEWLQETFNSELVTPDTTDFLMKLLQAEKCVPSASVKEFLTTKIIPTVMDELVAADSPNSTAAKQIMAYLLGRVVG